MELRRSSPTIERSSRLWRRARENDADRSLSREAPILGSALRIGALPARDLRPLLSSAPIRGALVASQPARSAAPPPATAILHPLDCRDGRATAAGRRRV